MSLLPGFTGVSLVNRSFLVISILSLSFSVGMLRWIFSVGLECSDKSFLRLVSSVNFLLALGEEKNKP